MSPFVAGLLCRCPNCGKGPLFEGYLKVRAKCEACAFDLSKTDSGDGPAVFVILIGGFICAFGAVYTQIVYDPPVWLQLVLWLPLSVAVCAGLLRPTKGLLVAAQFANKASEAGRRDL
jgi:uncharacterized protein (DUF983 family)